MAHGEELVRSKKVQKFSKTSQFKLTFLTLPVPIPGEEKKLT